MYKKILIISMFIVSLFGVTVFAHNPETMYEYEVDYEFSGYGVEKYWVYACKPLVFYQADGGKSLKFKAVDGTSFARTYSSRRQVPYPTLSNSDGYDDITLSSSTSTLVSLNYVENVFVNGEYVPPSPPEPERPTYPDEIGINSLFINNLKENIKVTGYLTGTSPLKWYDIEVYGKFINDSSVIVNASLLKTYIINNTVVWHGDEKRRMGEGLGSKSFRWIQTPSGKGTIGEFKMVVTMPMLKEGVHNVTLGTTINLQEQTREYVWLTDTIKNVEFLGDNFEDNFEKPPVDVPEDGTSGQVGGVGGNGTSDIPQVPEDGNIIDWLKYFFDVILWLVTYPFVLIGEIIGTLMNYIIDLFKSLAPVGDYLRQVLSFIPSDIMNVLWGILSFSILFSTIKMVTGYMRGR